MSTIVLDSDNDLDLLHVPSPEERAAWIPKLHEMFPDVSATKLELTARMSTSLQEAVEEVCDTEGATGIDLCIQSTPDNSNLALTRTKIDFPRVSVIHSL